MSEEIKTLHKLYSKDSFEFVAVYGRRRVGKTTLIKGFIKEKKPLYP